MGTTFQYKCNVCGKWLYEDNTLESHINENPTHFATEHMRYADASLYGEFITQENSPPEDLPVQLTSSESVFQEAPPETPLSGQTWVRVSDSELFFYDAGRDAFLSNKIFTTTFSKEQISFGTYLDFSDTIASSKLPFALPFNAILTNIILDSANASSWTINIQKAGLTESEQEIAINNAKTLSRDDINIPFEKGEQVQVFAKGTGPILYPRTTLIFTKSS